MIPKGNSGMLKYPRIQFLREHLLDSRETLRTLRLARWSGRKTGIEMGLCPDRVGLPVRLVEQVTEQLARILLSARC